MFLQEGKPLVSCVVLSYNSGDKILKAIDSVCQQTYPNIELIIADDASSVFEKEKINEKIKDKFCYTNIIVNKENLGTVKNYNNAVKAAQGKYIFNLAADDTFFDKNTFELLVKAFEESNSDIIVANAAEKNSGKIMNYSMKKKYLGNINKKRILNELGRGNFISGSTTYYTKQYFGKYGKFDEDLFLVEDWPNILKAFSKEAKVTYLDKTTLLYSMGGVSTIADKSELYLKDYSKIIDKYVLHNKDMSHFTKRYEKYMLERIKFKKKMPLKVQLKYLDVIVYKCFERIIYDK